MKLIGKTTSKAPFVMGLVGGILGIIAGFCNGVCYQAAQEAAQQAGAVIEGFEEINWGLLSTCGYLVLAFSVVGLVMGCMSKSNNYGTLLLLVCGIACGVLTGVMWAAQGGFPGIFVVAAAVLFIIGGFVGLNAMGGDAPAAPPSDTQA